MCYSIRHFITRRGSEAMSLSIQVRGTKISTELHPPGLYTHPVKYLDMAKYLFVQPSAPKSAA